MCKRIQTRTGAPLTVWKLKAVTVFVQFRGQIHLLTLLEDAVAAISGQSADADEGIQGQTCALAVTFFVQSRALKSHASGTSLEVTVFVLIARRRVVEARVSAQIPLPQNPALTRSFRG